MDLPFEIAFSAMVVWPLFALACFLVLTPVRAVAVAWIVGTLFLPVFTFKLPGLPLLDRILVVNALVWFLALWFGRDRLRGLRPSLWDLPLVLFCLTPFASSLANGLGWYDAWSATWVRAFQYGAAFLLGRVFFDGEHEVRSFARAIVFGGLVYVPLCWFESRHGNLLHPLVYGTDVIDWQTNFRSGGYRPQVFQVNGLVTCFWVAVAFVLAVAERRGASDDESRTFWTVVTLGLGAGVVANRSLSALCLAGLGAAVVLLPAWRALAITSTSLAGAYFFTRATGAWSGDTLVSIARVLFGPDRAWSLHYRLWNDDLIVRHALSHPFFGWGGWNRGAVYSQASESFVTMFDALWSLVLAENGLVGLVALSAALVTPVWVIASRKGGRVECNARTLVAILVMVVIEGALNDLQNPVWMGVVGALTALAKKKAEAEAPAPSSQLLLNQTVNFAAVVDD